MKALFAAAVIAVAVFTAPPVPEDHPLWNCHDQGNRSCVATTTTALPPWSWE